MTPALFLLMLLRFRGWWRRLWRNVTTLRGAIFVAFGVVLSSCWIFSLLLSPHTPDPANLEKVRRFAPLVLLGYCLLTVLTSAGDRSLTFSPAEVNLLFAGPFTRRQILSYKIMTAVVSTLFSGAIFTVVVRMYAPSTLAAFLAVLLALLFLQFFGIAVALLSETIGEYASNARRKLGFGLLGLLAATVVLSVGRDFFGLKPLELLARVEAAPVLQVLLTPFRWFGETFTADSGPELIRGVLLCLLVDGLLLALVFLLDAHYLEAASAASERVYRRLERMRAGPAAAMSSGGTARFTLPSLPCWGGLGPIAWRQALTAVRNLKGLLFILLTFASFLLVPFAVQQDEHTPDTLVARILGGTVLGMSIFLMQLLSFDFRADLDRMDVLKSLPLAPTMIVLGQLFTPVALACGLQFSSFLFIELAMGGLGWVLGAVLVFLVPFNLLLFEVMNLLFLWFPTRMTPTTAGDFQMMGRQTMLFFAIYFIVGVLAVIPLAAGLVLYHLFGADLLISLGTAWLLLAAIVTSLVPLLACAFRGFDVARDTPP